MFFTNVILKKERQKFFNIIQYLAIFAIIDFLKIINGHPDKVSMIFIFRSVPIYRYIHVHNTSFKTITK